MNEQLPIYNMESTNERVSRLRLASVILVKYFPLSSPNLLLVYKKRNFEILTSKSIKNLAIENKPYYKTKYTLYMCFFVYEKAPLASTHAYALYLYQPLCTAGLLPEIKICNNKNSFPHCSKKAATKWLYISDLRILNGQSLIFFFFICKLALRFEWPLIILI